MTAEVVFTVNSAELQVPNWYTGVVTGTEQIDDLMLHCIHNKAQNLQQVLNFRIPADPGTLPYTLGGIALIMAALMYVLKMRRRVKA